MLPNLRITPWDNPAWLNDGGGVVGVYSTPINIKNFKKKKFQKKF